MDNRPNQSTSVAHTFDSFSLINLIFWPINFSISRIQREKFFRCSERISRRGAAIAITDQQALV